MDVLVLPNPIKPKTDSKEYRHIKLFNGLHALLIKDLRGDVFIDCEDDVLMDSDTSSDEDIGSSGDEEIDDIDSVGSGKKPALKKKQAAAALCVGVGSFSDPDDIPGLAHFLEHMVFMGSSLYPDENYFDMFIKRHGGDSNAFTDCERTVFKFEINPAYLEEALKIWAQFFICPLMKKKSINDEVKNIDTEFKMALVDDHTRGEQLLGTFCAQGHPIGKFLWGNEKTLKKTPARNGIKVYDALKNFHRKYYNAQRMSLVVQSVEDLDILQQWVVKIFSEIPNNPEAEVVQFSPHVPYPVEGHTPFKVCNIVPISKMQELHMTWFVPPQLENYETKPLHYLGWLVAHEGKESLLSLLKKEHLALELTVEEAESGFFDTSLYSIFTIEINLTDKGCKEYGRVMDLVFQFMLMLRKAGSNERIFKEIQQIENIDFTYIEEEHPLDYAEDLCEMMQLYSPEEILTGDQLLTKYDANIIENIQNFFLPQNCLVFFYHHSADQHDEVKHKKEPWFGTKYTITSVDEKWKKRWENGDLQVHPDLDFPSPNNFIVSDFTLHNSDSSPEASASVHLLSTKFPECSLWFKQDAKFNLPKAFIRMHLVNSLATISPEHFAYLDLLNIILDHEMAEDVYPADAASLEYSISISSQASLTVKVSGFNEKLVVLLSTILGHLVNLSCSRQTFEEQKKELRRIYHNQLISPKKLCRDLRLSILEKLRFPKHDLYSASANLTLEGFQSFVSDFHSCFHIDCLIQGNYTEQQAVTVFENCVDVLNCSLLTAADVPPPRTLQLQPVETYLKVKSMNDEDENSIVTLYIQYGSGNVYENTMLQVLTMFMEEPCFDVLRTKKQLGYSVFVYDHNTSGVLGLSLNVLTQVSKFKVEEATIEMKRFLTEDFNSYLSNMKQEEFDEQVNSLIVLKTNEDSKLVEEVDRNWDEIVLGDCNFDRLDQEVSYLKRVTFDELKEFYRKVCFTIQSILIVQVQGNCKSNQPPTDLIPLSSASQAFDCELTLLPPEGPQSSATHLTCLNTYIKSSFYHPVSYVLDTVCNDQV